MNATVSDRRRRVALIVGLVAVVGQESCGMLSITQYAERLFMLTRAEAAAGSPSSSPQLATPARQALLLGAVQLLSSVLALYLVERLGRRVTMTI